MPTVLTHGLTALAMGSLAYTPRLPPRFWWLAMSCAMLPDIDVLGFQLGIVYGDLWGHRGMTHSLLFALVISLCVVSLFFAADKYKSQRMRLVLFYFLVTASHGLFDALTNGGLGIAFFAPFDSTRYFLPVQPISVSPIGIENFFSHGGYAVLMSELFWLGIPTACLLLVGGWRYYKISRPVSNNP